MNSFGAHGEEALVPEPPVTTLLGFRSPCLLVTKPRSAGEVAVKSGSRKEKNARASSKRMGTAE